MTGRRVLYRESWEEGNGPLPGDFWQTPDGTWGGVCPSGDFCNLSKHQVVEHEDGTITVHPSILVGRNLMSSGTPDVTWHGYLRRGEWVAC